jgi:hypothetical protein
MILAPLECKSFSPQADLEGPISAAGLTRIGLIAIRASYKGRLFVTASCCVKMNDSMEIVPDSGERFGQLQSQVQQFPVNAWRAPTRIGRAHLANQIDELARDRRPALPMATLPAPVQPKSLSVPGDHRFRLDNRKGRSPTIPKLREPCPEDSICDAELYFVGTLQTLKDQELMTKGHDLRMERSSVSVSLSNRMEQREDDREHIERTVSGSAQIQLAQSVRSFR